MAALSPPSCAAKQSIACPNPLQPARPPPVCSPSGSPGFSPPTLAASLPTGRVAPALRNTYTALAGSGALTAGALARLPEFGARVDGVELALANLAASDYQQAAAAPAEDAYYVGRSQQVGACHASKAAGHAGARVTRSGNKRTKQGLEQLKSACL